MSVPEFVTMVAFYCDNPNVVVSKALLMALFAKIQDSCPEFNELQLVMLKTSIEKYFTNERQNYKELKDEEFLEKAFGGDK